MASAQVMFNSAVSSRKQEHLEAGKRRLEEFRKKKAAAKKGASTTSQTRSADSTVHEKRPSENGHAQFSISVDAAVDTRMNAVTETSGIQDHDNKSHELTNAFGSESVAVAQIDAQGHNVGLPNLLQKRRKQEEDNPNSLSLGFQTSSMYQQEKESKAGSIGTDTTEGMYANAIPSGGSVASGKKSSSYFHSTLYGVEEHLATKDNRSESLPNTASNRNGFATKGCPEEAATNITYYESVHSTSNWPSYTSQASSQNSVVELDNHVISGLGGRKLNTSEGNWSILYRQQASEPPSAGFDSSATLNDPLYTSVADTYSRRSRPSFLDSLNIGRDSITSSWSYSEKESYMSSSKLPNSDLKVSSVMQELSTACAPVEPLPTPASSNVAIGFFGSAFAGEKVLENSVGSGLETTKRTQNEDFAALEQHIEDLTQEKFSVQRALEASKGLTESLAAENSSLTESYNQQASIVNQLKDEIERLQGEIKARLVELEATKAEYMNAQLECNAADERAKLLASEVICLEEKTLRLRSNELKLERELENANAEIASHKKKIASLDKERQDLVQTIDALQEEKKVLQFKLLRASASGNSVDVSKGHAKRDASTSTNDIGLDAAGTGDNSELASSIVQAHEDADNLLLFLQNRASTHDDLAMIIPQDHVQMIQNINSLISEIKVEKEELIQALITEVSTSTRLKDLNKELSRKLEVQTQRLELLTAQSMASEHVPAREPTGSRIVLESVAYADEGDEVVERVLGWIMKLFPGGPAKRRPSRL